MRPAAAAARYDMSEPTSLPRWVRPALLLLLLAAFAVRLHELTRQDIWWDEARNIDVSLRPFLAIATAPELDIHPPVYFWLLHVWARPVGIAVGDAPERVAWVARSLSVFAGVAGVALLWALARRTAGWGAGLAAAAVSGAAAFWLAESQEARMYTVGFALLAAAALALLAGLAAEDGGDLRARNRRLAAFVLLSTAALLNHYNTVFILAAWYLWWGARALLAAERWRRLRTAFLCGLANVLLALPAAPLALRQIPDYANPNLVVPSLAGYLRQNWAAYLGGYSFDPALLGGQGALWLWSALAVLAGGLAAWLLRRGRQGGELAALSFLLVWLALGLALYYIAVLDRGAFNVRYSSFVTPALYALLGVALAGWARLWRPLAVIAAIVLLAGFPAAARADLYDARFAREDVSDLAGWLRNTAGPQDVVFVDQKYPFGFYYQRYAIDPAANPEGSEAAPARYLFVDINTIDQRLNEWATNARRVFWVQWFESDTDPRRAVAFLLDKAGARQGEQSFQGYSVDWWELTPPTHFELAAGFAPAQHRWPPAVQTVELALPDAPVAAGDSIFAAIRWQRAAPQTVGRGLKARLALYDGGSRIAQSDERILNDRHVMPDEWSMDDRPLNVYRIDTPPDLAPGSYTLGLLVYDADTLEALTLVDETGAPAGQEATIGTVQIAAPQASGAQD